MIAASENKHVTNLFCRQSHHMNTSVIMMVQDLFYNGSQRKTFLRCAHYLVLFFSLLDYSSIYAVARKIMPLKVTLFLNIFELATEKPHSYLFVDGKPQTPASARYRTDIFDFYKKNFCCQSLDTMKKSKALAH